MSKRSRYKRYKKSGDKLPSQEIREEYESDNNVEAFSFINMPKLKAYFLFFLIFVIGNSVEGFPIERSISKRSFFDSPLFISAIMSAIFKFNIRSDDNALLAESYSTRINSATTEPVGNHHHRKQYRQNIDKLKYIGLG